MPDNKIQFSRGAAIALLILMLEGTSSFNEP